jgi:hypothetical protein
LLWQQWDTSSDIVFPSEKMASKSTATAENFLGAAAAAGSPSWTPTGGTAIAIKGPNAAGKFFLEARYEPRTGCKSKDRIPVYSTDANHPGKPGFMGCYHSKSWSTKAAACAAIDHFRAWVDGEKFLPLQRVRKFARKTRAYRRAYREGQPNSLADVEKLVIPT